MAIVDGDVVFFLEAFESEPVLLSELGEVWAIEDVKEFLGILFGFFLELGGFVFFAQEQFVFDGCLQSSSLSICSRFPKHKQKKMWIQKWCNSFNSACHY